MDKLENDKIKEFYQNSEVFERLAEVTRVSWIEKKLVPPDYTLERTCNFLNTMEKRFPHLVIFLINENRKIIGWTGISKSDKGQLEIDRWHPIIHPNVDEEDLSMHLLNECLNYADQNKYKEITVSFAIDNENDQNLFDTYYRIYKTCNFKKSYEMIFMVLDLPEKLLLSDIQAFNLQQAPLVDVDEEKIAECLHQSFKHSKDRFFKDLSNKEVGEEFKRRIDPISEINKSSIVLKDDNTVIGFGLVKNREFDTHLDLLCIDPDYRNKGYTKFIMEHIITSLKKQEVASLTLGVDPINSATLSLYKKIGFKKIKSIVELSFISS
jgi:ribosomal protein S18 acetylase RimI-like enzyme